MVDGFPAGVKIDSAPIDVELRRRQGGYGRGGRQRIESDHVDIKSGIWQSTTLGSPIALEVVNRDYKLERLSDLERPRPGHGDLTGAMKTLGRSAARSSEPAGETTVRVAAGACRAIACRIRHSALGYVVELGGVKVEPKPGLLEEYRRGGIRASSTRSIRIRMNNSKTMIDDCGRDGDTLGGIVEVRVEDRHSAWERMPNGIASSMADWHKL